MAPIPRRHCSRVQPTTSVNHPATPRLHLLIQPSVNRARERIPSPIWASIHPVWRRCSSFQYEEYAQSSRLARQASQHPNRGRYSCANPYRQAGRGTSWKGSSSQGRQMGLLGCLRKTLESVAIDAWLGWMRLAEDP